MALNDAIRQLEPDEDGAEVWEADQYTLTVPALPGLAARIERDFDKWLERAKNATPPEASDRQRLDEIEAAIIEIAAIVGGE